MASLEKFSKKAKGNKEPNSEKKRAPRRPTKQSRNRQAKRGSANGCGVSWYSTKHFTNEHNYYIGYLEITFSHHPNAFPHSISVLIFSVGVFFYLVSYFLFCIVCTIIVILGVFCQSNVYNHCMLLLFLSSFRQIFLEYLLLLLLLSTWGVCCESIVYMYYHNVHIVHNVSFSFVLCLFRFVMCDCPLLRCTNMMALVKIELLFLMGCRFNG